MLAVVAEEEENEQAWLWLSGVVKTDEDRRICLENVLALNPHNTAARNGLDRLKPSPAKAVAVPEAGDNPAETEAPQGMRREYAPISPAAAVLYPERQVKEWQWPDAPVTQKPAVGGYQATSNYQDVWSRDGDLCAYCAHEVSEDDEHCPKCRRSLFGSQYMLTNPSVNLHIYWILLLGLGQMFFVQLLVDLIVRDQLFSVVMHAILMGLFFVLAAGIYFRQFWAFAMSVFILTLITFVMMINLLTAGAVSSLIIGNVPGAVPANVLADNLYAFIGDSLLWLVDLIQPFQMVTALFALFYGVFKVGFDFSRVHIRHIAQAQRGLRDSTEFYSAGKEYARMGMWANAVLHWQRAAALEPNQISYQRAVAHAYLVLGFYERSLDLLQSAEHSTMNTAVKKELQQLIQLVRQKQALSQQKTTKS